MKRPTLATRPSTVKRSRRLRGVVAVVAVAVLTASGLHTSELAGAAPGDPVVFADANLQAAVNAELGQSAGATVTEAQAATITSLDANSDNIGDLGGIEYLTSLARLALHDNQISDVSALGSLTNLTRLYLSANQISDVSPLGSLTSLTTLELYDNQISDVSALGSLTNLTSLTNFFLTLQSVTVPSAGTGDAISNPVVDLSGSPVAVSSTDSGFSYDSGSNTWSFATPGLKTITWSTTVTIGSENARFSGTISQDIGEDTGPVAVTPQAPTVTQAACVDGEIVGPQIDLATTDGLTYAIIGDVEPGATVTVVAEPDGEVYLVDPSGDWVVSDHITAAMEITLDSVDCATPESTTPRPIVPPTRPTPTASAAPAAPVSAQPAYTG